MNTKELDKIKAYLIEQGKNYTCRPPAAGYVLQPEHWINECFAELRANIKKYKIKGLADDHPAQYDFNQYMTENNNLYKRAIAQWGKPLQMIMALEEMAELQKELTKNMRGKDNKVAICEEIADVDIMLGQLKVMFDGQELKDGTVVEIAKKIKLERLERMLNENTPAKDVVNRTGEGAKS